ncbi:glutathione S-transferase N-terminal domain-containing protein [Tardiphaga sp. P9-11]|uniref:glutathione S-transferase family protein n=1 Tax=Tardiphaga sp. P9-11 TaxID=2024614 RepID=UPI0011F28929|nr:glutathione S-transferase N-terminal domain-containing protein [Tardiphaga sp. P9-11]KAA0070414.1 glutathione S-transferase [Tardiphaga sp. P9-11]
MKLFYAPGACSIGIHYLLETIGHPYDRQKIDIKTGENRQPWYLAINPKAKVPTLQRDDGSVLTEFPVIAQHIAASAPDTGLVPSDSERALRAAELTDYLVSTLHMQGFSRIFRPAKFCEDPATHDAIQREGRYVVAAGLAVVERDLKQGGALHGEATFADAALFYVLFWAIDRAKLEVPAAGAERYARLKSSDAARRVFAEEGITL